MSIDICKAFSQTSPQQRVAPADITALTLAAIAGASLSALIFHIQAPLKLANYNDIWFQADINRVINDLVNPGLGHVRANVHPFFALLGAPAVMAIGASLRLTPLQAAACLMNILAALWGALLFLLLRRSGCRTASAGLYTAIGLLSSANLLYCGIVETYVAGSISVLLALLAAASVSHKRWSAGAFIAVGALAFGITITNWFGAAGATLLSWPRRKAITIVFSGMAAGIGLAVLQGILLPDNRMFWHLGAERSFLRQIDVQSVALALYTALVNSIMLAKVGTAAPGEMTAQTFLPSSVIGAIGALAWVALLTIGIAALLRMPSQRALRLSAGFILAFNLALHSVYGSETVLYSLHFVPALIVIAALSEHTRLSRISRALALTVLVCQVAANLPELARAIEMAARLSVAQG
ncbi:MAG: hypothetical protein IT209_10760 [Armatimonadetes bacterium]|nr:hypothetical protein [Armatimonadota bacterium]